MFKSGNKANVQNVQSGAQASGPNGLIKLEQFSSKPYPPASKYHSPRQAAEYQDSLTKLENGEKRIGQLIAGIPKARLHAEKGKTQQARDKAKVTLDKLVAAKANMEKNVERLRNQIPKTYNSIVRDGLKAEELAEATVRRVQATKERKEATAQRIKAEDKERQATETHKIALRRLHQADATIKREETKLAELHEKQQTLQAKYQYHSQKHQQLGQQLSALDAEKDRKLAKIDSDIHGIENKAANKAADTLRPYMTVQS